jgi:hypothetical protein
LKAISIAAIDELIRRAIMVRKRFTGLGEAEDYQAAAPAFERSVAPVACKPATKAEGTEIGGRIRIITATNRDWVDPLGSPCTVNL